MDLVVDDFILLPNKTLLGSNLLLNFEKDLGLGLLHELGHLFDEFLKVIVVGRATDGDLVLLEHLFNETEHSCGSVAASKQLRVQQLVGLQVGVEVDVVQEVETEELFNSLPVLVFGDCNLEKAHILGAELTHLIKLLFQHSNVLL